MKRIIKSCLVLLVCTNFAQAQVESGSFGLYEPSLLFSRTTPGGTARIQAIGGAQTALGGDLSSAYSNPAGIGFFNKSQFVFTPSVNFQDSKTNFLDANTTTFKNNFNIGNLGAVFKNSSKEGKFKGGAFAISINRINDFNNEYRFEGVNGNNSIVDSFIQNAGTTSTGNLTGLEAGAYDHFLIDLADYDSNLDYEIIDGVIKPFDGDGTFEGYGSLFGNIAGSNPTQQGSVRTSGAQYQWNFSYGANYDDLLYFGAGLGVQTVNYKRERTFIENDFRFSDGTSDNLIEEIRIDDKLDITGIGVNATFGLIVRPNDYLRLGASYTTPTALTLSQESTFDLNTSWNTDFSYATPTDTFALGSYEYLGDLVLSDYTLRSPSKLTTGMAVFLGKHGFISGDVEFVNYGKAQLKSNDFSPTADNRTISNLYANTINYRLGGEYRFDMFRLRAGYSYQGDPFSDGQIDRSIKRISGGIGYQMSNYFVDLAIVNAKSDALYRPYELSNTQDPVATINNNSTSVSVTVGFKF